MHVHVVLITLHDAADAPRVKTLMESMTGRIAGMVSLDARLNELPEPHACDIALTTRWVDAAAYEAYKTDPVHVEVATQIRTLMASASTLDYTD